MRIYGPETVQLTVGQLWTLYIRTDATDAPTVTLTPPSGPDVTPDVDLSDCTAHGAYMVQHVVDAAGQWVAEVASVDEGTVYAQAYAAAAAGYPTLADLRGPSAERDDPDNLGYLGQNSWSDTEIQDALTAETQAQRDVCRIPVAYPASLRQGLLRRVQRNLTMRGLPLALVQGDADAGGTTTLPGMDPEVRRLERPYRKIGGHFG